MHHKTRNFVTGAAIVLAGVLNLNAAEALPSAEEMWKLIQQQQKQIEALTKRLESAEAKNAVVEQKTAAVEQKVEATSSYVETLAADGGVSGDAWYNKTSIGGYGELHYNSGGGKDELDFHRFVLFVNHEYSESIRLISEIEIEHAFASSTRRGEVKLEQAYIEFDLNDSSKAKAGLFLMPVGFLNETHEPNTFYGVERNVVESAIIPTTWYEGGGMFTKTFESGLSFDLALHSGLKTAVGPDFANIRSGRQGVSYADMQDAAATVRMKFTGVPGLDIGTTINYQTDIAQGLAPSGETADAVFTEVHADWRKGGFGLRALYANWMINGFEAAALGRDEQYGYYIEPSYRFPVGDGKELGFFARYSVVDNAAGDNVDSENHYTDFGVNFWPHPQVVLKADIQFADLVNNDDQILNLGVGFQF